MLIDAVECYLAVRRAAGFELKSEGCLLERASPDSQTKEATVTSALKQQSHGLDWRNPFVNGRAVWVM